MSWKYSQSSGILTYNDTVIYWKGYSGKGSDKNDPAMADFPFWGPIPLGVYRMRLTPHSVFAHPAFLLIPEGHNASHRTAFFIHGESAQSFGDSSRGCIILPPDVRKKILQYKNDLLEVVP